MFRSATNRVIGATLAAAVVLGACSSDPPISAPGGDAAAAPATTEAATATPTETGTSPTGAVSATVGSSAIGDILVGGDGLTLYGFTNDTDAASTCYGTCAEAWPPVIVDADWDVAPGLDAGIFATTTRDDGQLQLVAGQWPLYWFAGDAVPGDLNGQGSGDVWWAVAPDGSLVMEAAAAQETEPDDPAVVTAGSTALGDILVDADGLSLYGFTNDTDGVPTCEGDCADAWPPLLLAAAELPAGLDDSVFSVVERSDGTFQLKAGAWPLYRFAGDSAAGDVNGQGSGDVWFAVAPDGSLVRDTPSSAPATSSDDDRY